MKDLIVVGAGPAGITASIYAARKQMDFLTISKDVGGQTSWSSDIENYTGYQFITGIELAQKFRKHLEEFDVTLNEGETVTLVEKRDRGIAVETDKGSYQARCVIVASGRVPRSLEVEGEAEFRGRGVTYCATCDGPLFAGKDVAVIGGGNSALEAALQMMKIAGQVYLFDIAPELSADPVMVEKARAGGNVHFHTNSRVQRISGDAFVTGIEVLVGDEQRTFKVGGILIEIGSMPSSGFVKGVARNDYGEIVVDCATKTDVPGIFAAGDVTDVYAKQIIVACGEGAKAALAAFEWISTNL
jgi:alkyl hydroperoxide reductase subunit F